MNYRLVFIVSVLMAVGCDPSSPPGPVETGASGVYVINEGAYNAGNAELSFINPESRTVSGSVYSVSNPGSLLGDIAQSGSLAFGRLYVAVNNSRKLVVIGAGTHRSLQTINLPRMPRSVSLVSPIKAYVTNMDSTVSVVDLTAGAEVGRVNVGSFPEGIVVVAGSAYVFNGGFGYGNSISVINTLSDSVSKTIQTPLGPSYGVVTSSGLLHVVCTGYESYTDPLDHVPGAVLTLDGMTGSVLDTLWMSGVAGKIAMAADGSLFVIGPGSGGAQSVWKLTGGPSPSVLSMNISTGSYYGIGVDPDRAELYLALPGDFVSNGRVEVRTFSGSLVREYTTGIGVAPNGFVFVP